MKIVIDIPKEKYEWMKEHKGVTDYQTTVMLYKKVLNGVILPETCGRLIDADALVDKYDVDFINARVDGEYVNAPTILEGNAGDS